MGLRRTLVSAAVQRLLRWHGVECGPGLIAYGLPFVARVAGSRIALGTRVALCSSTRANPLGVNHRIVLRTLAPGSEIVIGDDTGLSGASICAARSVTIGQCCLLGANVTVTDYDFHALGPANRRYTTERDAIGCAPVVIEDNVWLGLNVIVLKGVHIGANSVVAAGSVVTGSLPANCVAGGVPAKVLRMLDTA